MVLRNYIKTAAAKRCKKHMVETDEFVSSNSEGFLMDSFTSSTAYLKMKKLCIDLSNEIQAVIKIHNEHVLPRNYQGETFRVNSFREVCPSCGVEYVRDFEVETIEMKETPIHCSAMNCMSGLRDSVLDMKDELPRKEMDLAEKHYQMADVVLCLGTR